MREIPWNDNPAFELSVNASLILSPDLRVIAGNRRFLSISGYTMEELRDKPLSSFAETDAPEQNLFFAQNSGTTHNVTFRLKHRDGTLLVLEGLANRLPHSGEYFVQLDDTGMCDDNGDYLLDSLKRLKDAHRLASLAHWALDMNTGETYWSPELYELLGVIPGEVQPSFRFFLKQVHPEDRMRIRELTKRWVDDRKGAAVSFRFTRKDGSERTARANTDIDYAEGTRFILHGILQDTTEEHRREDELHRLWDIVDRAPVSIVITNTESVIEYANPYFSAVTGYTLDEVKGNKPNILKSDTLGDSYYKNLYETLIEGKTWTGEFYNKKKNGDHYWEKAVISPYLNRDGVITHYIAVKEDITELKESREVLARALMELETIFNTSSVAIMMLKEGRTIYRVNRRFQEIFGYTEKEIVGQTVRILHRSEESHREFGEKYYNSLAGGKIISVDYPLLDKRGNTVWCGLSGQAVSKENLDNGVIWIINDISETKRLGDLKEGIEQIMRHDLKTPLNALIGFPDILLSETNLDDLQREYITYIRDAAAMMLNQINSTLDIYRIETGNFTYTPVMIKLHDYFTRVVATMQSMISDRGVSVTYRGREEGTVLAHEALLYSVLTNLIKNAIEATPRGGTVTLSLREDTVSIISVHNPGVIPEEVRPHFFEKFTSAGKPHGMGLGTYSARLMTNVMHGTIAFSSNESEGTSIIITLPLPA